MKSNILAFLILATSFAVVSSVVVEPTYTIAADATIQAEDAPLQFLDVDGYDEEAEHIRFHEFAGRPTVPQPQPTPPPKKTQTVPPKAYQPEATPASHETDQNDDVDDHNDTIEGSSDVAEDLDEVTPEIEGADADFDAYWPEEFEDWEMYGWEGMHDEF